VAAAAATEAATAAFKPEEQDKLLKQYKEAKSQCVYNLLAHSLCERGQVVFKSRLNSLKLN